MRNFKLRLNILMDEYFVQDSNFSAKLTSVILACKAVSTDFNTTQVDFGGW